MKSFEKSIKAGDKEIEFKFEPSYFGDSLMYLVIFWNEGRNETFRMGMDENGMRKIKAQVLPKEIHDIELDLNDAIEEANEMI